MSLKKLLKEAVVVDSMYDIENELLTIKESILEQTITEGVDDPGILKCVLCPTLRECGCYMSCIFAEA